MVQTQSEAKRYFVEKVVQQARSEGVILSDAERGMLSWSVGEDPGAMETWRQAYAVLGQGDHYILIMIDQLVDLKRKQWWKFWKSVSGLRRSGSE